MSVSDDRGQECRMISEHLLAALEQLVWRYRALQPGVADADLYAEAITAEAAWQVDVARRALHLRPEYARG
jgi:hypothetical protein